MQVLSLARILSILKIINSATTIWEINCRTSEPLDIAMFYAWSLVICVNRTLKEEVLALNYLSGCSHIKSRSLIYKNSKPPLSLRSLPSLEPLSNIQHHLDRIKEFDQDLYLKGKPSLTIADIKMSPIKDCHLKVRRSLTAELKMCLKDNQGKAFNLLLM